MARPVENTDDVVTNARRIAAEQAKVSLDERIGGVDEADLDKAFVMLAQWIASPAGTHGPTTDRAIRALRCLTISNVADRAEALLAAADDPATLKRWRELKTTVDPAEAHLLTLASQRGRWLRECEAQLRDLGVKPAHHR